MKLGPYPVPVKLLRRLICRSSSSKGIKNDVARLCRDKNGSFRNHQLQFIDTWADFEFCVTIWRCIGPEIRQIHSLSIHLVSMTAVISDFLSAMPAFLYWQPNFVENTGRAPGVVKERIVCRIQLFSTWIGALHCKSDPMSEVQFFFQDRGKLYRKFGCSIDKERSSRFQHSATFVNPDPAPGQVRIAIHHIVVAILVVLPDIERRIGKNGIDDLGLHALQDMEAVGVVEDSVRRGQKWLHHLTDSLHFIRLFHSALPGNKPLPAVTAASKIRGSVPPRNLVGIRWLVVASCMMGRW